jgi:PAS domain S-box-containing protein
MGSKSYYSSAIYEVAKSINSSLNLSQVLNLMAKSTAQATHAKACSLRLLSPDKQLLIMGGAYGLSQGYLRKGNVEVEKSQIDQEALQGKTGIIPDATNDPRFQYPEGAKSESIRSILVVPLMVRDNPVGVMRLYTKDVHEFEEEDIGFIHAVANLGAIAIENAKLYEAMKQELGDLTEDINEMAERLHESRMQIAQQMDDLNYEKKRLETILASMGEGVVVTDPDYNILLINSPAEALLSVSRLEVTGKNADAILPVKKSELEQIFEDVAGSTSVAPLVRKFQQKVLSILINPIRDETGELLGSVSLLRDITEQAAIEAMKTEFISIVSHELRTPLTPIKGYIDLIVEGDAGDITEEQANYLHIVQANTDALAALVNDLLDISKIEAGRIDLEIKPIQMETVIQEAVAIHRQALESKGLKINISLPPDLPPVRADRGRVAQVLNNLINNAYKYSNPGGLVSVTALAEGDFLEVAIADTGVGISKEDQKKLFTKFFRAKNPATREAGGTGLGLAISKSIVEKHKGEIWVESQLGKGSAFHFTIPLVVPLPLKEKPRTATRRDTKRILVVEDETNTAAHLRFLLERVGYRVVLVGSGEEALARIGECQPDLITMDITLPGIDGFETIRLIRENPSLETTPIVIISEIQDEEKASALEVATSLAKPIDEDKLLENIEKILAEGQKILVCDPDAATRQLLEETLLQKGYHLLFVQDGLDLLVQARKNQPQLIIMDLQLSDMDGYEVLRRLNRRPETVDIPVIAMTNNVEESHIEVIAAGANDLIRKPLDVEALVEEVERFMKDLGE